MTLFLLNESRNRNVASDITIFKSLDSLALHIEPVDVENGEFFLFDTDGFFYSITNTGKFDSYIFEKTGRDAALARSLVRDYLALLGKAYDDVRDLESNAARIDRAI